MDTPPPKKRRFAENNPARLAFEEVAAIELQFAYAWEMRGAAYVQPNPNGEVAIRVCVEDERRIASQ